MYKRKRFVVRGICFVLMLSLIAPLYPSEIMAQSEWEEPGVYPVSPSDDEWKTMTFSELLESANMPEEVLKETSTEMLLKWVMEYPFLADVAAHDLPEDGIEWLKQTSNICREFMSRDDSRRILIDFYFSLNYEELDRSTLFRYKTFFNAYFSSVGKNMSNDEIQIVKQIDQIQKQAGVTALNGLLLDEQSFEEKKVAVEGAKGVTSGFINSGVIKTSIYDTLCFYGSYNKYGASASGCYKYISGEASSTEIEAADEYFQSTHMLWFKLYSASKKYNCNAFAWIDASSSNSFILLHPDAYTNSSQVSLVNTNGSAVNGDKIVLYNSSGTSVHSLIAISSGNNSSSILTKSKIGSFGVYMASLSAVMLDYGVTTYKVYR